MILPQWHHSMNCVTGGNRRNRKTDKPTCYSPSHLTAVSISIAVWYGRGAMCATLDRRHLGRLCGVSHGRSVRDHFPARPLRCPETPFKGDHVSHNTCSAQATASLLPRTTRVYFPLLIPSFKLRSSDTHLKNQSDSNPATT